MEHELWSLILLISPTIVKGLLPPTDIPIPSYQLKFDVPCTPSKAIRYFSEVGFEPFYQTKNIAKV